MRFIVLASWGRERPQAVNRTATAGDLLAVAGDIERQPGLIVTVTPESLVPRFHPIRNVKAVADQALRLLGPRLGELSLEGGCKSVPPEMLLKTQIQICLYSVRSKRLFCERLLTADVYLDFFTEVVEEARRRRLLPDDHFTVDGRMIETLPR